MYWQSSSRGSNRKKKVSTNLKERQTTLQSRQKKPQHLFYVSRNGKKILFVCLLLIDSYVFVGRAEKNAKNYQQALKEKQQHKLESIQTKQQLHVLATQLARFQQKEESVNEFKREANDATVAAKEAATSLERVQKR